MPPPINFKAFKEGSLTQTNTEQPATKTEEVLGKVSTGVAIAAATATAVDAAVTGGPENPDTPLPGEQKAEEITQLAASIASLVPGIGLYGKAAVGLEPVIFHLISALVHLFKHHAHTVAAQQTQPAKQ